MAHRKQFENVLKELFKRRTNWLTGEVFSRRPGKPPSFSRRILNSKINELQKIVSHAFARTIAKDEFTKCVTCNKSWHIRGRGPEEKGNNFKKWLGRYFSNSKNLVYIFWGNRNRCIYVGRTNSGLHRPVSQFDKHWIHKAKRIDIYLTKSYKDIPKLECLAIHRFEPLHNRQKAATKDWTSKCPLCQIHKWVEYELKNIFMN